MTQLRFEEKVKVLNKLQEVCRLNSDGYATYDEGWSDVELTAWAAANVSPTANLNHIMLMRATQIGKLRAARAMVVKKGASVVDEARIAAIEASIKALRVQADETLKRVTAMEVRLAGLYHPQPSLDLTGTTAISPLKSPLS